MRKSRSLPKAATIAATIALALTGVALPQVALGAQTQALGEDDPADMAVAAIDLPQSGAGEETVSPGPEAGSQAGSETGPEAGAEVTPEPEPGLGATDPAEVEDAEAATTVVAGDGLPILGTIDPFTALLTRLGGSDRYATSRQVAAKFNAPVPAVFVTTGTDFPDALSAGAAAATFGAPLLLTPQGKMDQLTLNQIVALQPSSVFVIGGAGAVSDGVLGQLEEATGISPERIGGSDRYDTSLKVAQRFFTSAKFAVVATGATFADALTASGVAGAKSGPVVLVNGKAQSTPGSVVNALSDLGVSNVLVAGGTGAVSAGIVKQLGGKFSVTRKGGSDRYATAAAINTAYFPKGSVSQAFVATGTNFPDALSGAAMAGRMGSPLYTTTATCMPPTVVTSMNTVAPAKRVVFGGKSVVSDASANGTKCVPAPKPPATTSPLLYTLRELQFHGVIRWNGYKFTYYSQSVLPGGGLVIPGRHVNANGYVADSNGYIVLAAPRGVAKGTVYDTPFGNKGKVYDTCASCTTSPMWLDVYTK